ncbi:MAG: [LysW]-aminoadipate kinase [Promethearchaeota archaeon]
MKICIKIGGALVKQGAEKVLKDVKDLSGTHEFVVVHGGGPQINDISTKMGITPRYITSPSGYKSRHTDPETIKIAILALAGEVNKALVQGLAREGVEAFGCTGCDGKILVATRKEKIVSVTPEGRRFMIRDDYSGKITKADGRVVEYLLSLGIVPVIGSLAITEKGEVVNCDGDRAASAIAVATGADILISLTDVEGVYRDLESREVIPNLSRGEAESVLKSLEGGMKKKVYAALEALDRGIPKVVIGSGTVDHPIKSLVEGVTGTTLSK